jgi:NADH dehydrogenase FAD-containing subunit
MNVTPRIVLLQKGESLLPELHHKSLSEFTLKKLQQNGIEVRLETSAQQKGILLHAMFST